MASSGSFSESVHNGHYALRVDWTAEQSIGDNSSVITAKVYFVNDWSISIGSRTDNTLTINNKTYKFNTAAISTTGTHLMATIKSDPIEHNNDGSKSVSLSCRWFMNATISGESYYGYITANGTAELDTIARGSQPSCITYPNHTQNVGSFGDTISIHMNRQSSAFTHTVRYAFGNLSGTCIDAETGKAATAVGTGFKWKIPESFMDLLPAVTSGSGTIYVDTYNGSTKVGTKYCGFTATVPSSVKPKCSIQVLDATNIKDTYGNLVRGLSKLYVKTTGTPAYSSPIRAFNVTANGAKYTEAEITTGFISKAGTTTVTATVTDKRGRTSDSASASFTVLDYTAPAVSRLTVVRCNEDGTINKRGAFVKVTFSASITSLNSKNNALYYLLYKKSSENSYTKVSLTDLTGKYSATDYEYIFPASPGSSYEVSVQAVDRHNTATRSTKTPTAVSILSWRGFKTSNGVEDGIGIGKVPEKPNTLQVGWDAEFENPVVFKNTHYAFSSIGAESTDGYILMARITVTATNSDTPITFVFSQRKAQSPMTVHACFESSSTTDPELKSFVYEGSNYEAFLTKSATSVWDLYVKKVSNSDTITLNRWHTSYRQMKRCTVDFVGSIATQVPTGLKGYYRAKPMVAESILDSFFPVGFILTLYSQADPNTMYPGTTWERITNAFLWACDANGEIGITGGEKTHTLTTAELPSHAHGSVYSGNASGTKTHAWLASGGTAMAYGTIETGGGQAHNNMPPYIQVAVWRRTG